MYYLPHLHSIKTNLNYEQLWSNLKKRGKGIKLLCTTYPETLKDALEQTVLPVIHIWANEKLFKAMSSISVM